MKKVLFISPHLSTGGLPQYLHTLMEKLNTVHDVYCVEYRFTAPEYIVQRNKIKSLLGDKFFSLSSGRTLQSVIEEVSPDIVHLQEMPEFFMNNEDAEWLYRESRPYFLAETSHDSSFNSENKIWYPDHFALISKYQKMEFQKLNIPIDIVEYDIEYKERQDRTSGLLELGLDPNLKHVLNVGLFTPRKNQAEIIEYARELEGQPIQFHLVGNTAPNFASYWVPLLESLPSNVKIWGERSDVDKFYSCMDLFLFTSRGHNQDKETSPLVIREAIGYNLPSLIYNLPVYLGMYDVYDNISYLDEKSKDYNTSLILEKLNLKDDTGVFQTLDGTKNFKSYVYDDSMVDAILKYGESAGMYWGSYIHNELIRCGLSISHGDVFLDLGANIGISTRYAQERGAKTYSIEPDPIVAKLLTQNCPTTTVLQRAVTNKSNDNLVLYHWPYNSVNVGPSYTASTVSLKDIIDSTGETIIDYLKVDIEGYEDCLFDNFPNSYFKRIRQIFIEHHNNDTLDFIVKLLESKNFKTTVECGNGQNYIYAINERFKLFDQSTAVVRYDNTSNKIIYSTTHNVSDFTVSVRDKHSRAVIWSTHYNSVVAGNEYWLIPVPKTFIDFESDPFIGGLVVDFFSGEYLLCSKTIDIKPIVSKPIVTIDNDTEPVFMNYNEFFIDKIYDKYLKDKTFNCVVDVGANTGMWLEYIWDKVPVKSNIYALEPNTKALKILENTYGNTINILKNALVTKDGLLELYVDNDNSLVSSISTYGRPYDNVHTVDGISCKTLLSQIQPNIVDLMKIDIESAEYDLIDSMTKSDFDRINSFLIEYHIFGPLTTFDRVQTLVDRLVEFGYTVSVEKLSTTGGYLFATKSATSLETNINKHSIKVKAVHLLLNGNEQKQQQLSIDNISYAMDRLGITYVQHFNDIYVDKPPTTRSRRPNDVVVTNNSDRIRMLPNSLTPAHYGCYDSFKNAVLSEFDSDVDFLMIFEGDALILNVDEFNMALTSLFESLKDNTKPMYISLGGRYDLDSAYPQSENLGEFNNHFIVTNKTIGCQCTVFPKSFRKKLKNNFRTLKWDALDIYFNDMCNVQDITILVSKKTLVTQYDGYSVIDGKFKTFKEFLI